MRALKFMCAMLLGIGLLVSVTACGGHDAPGADGKLVPADDDFANVFEAVLETQGDGAIARGGLAEAGFASPEFATTNVQVPGVDESDLLKTNGDLIAQVTDTGIEVSRANDGNPQHLATIDPHTPEGTAPFEIYLDGTTLIALRNGSFAIMPLIGDLTDAPTPRLGTGGSVEVDIYDLRDPENPRYVTTFGQSGMYSASRLVNAHLYLVSTYVVMGEIDETQPETFVPLVDEAGHERAVAANRMWIMPSVDMSVYTVVTAIDTRGDGALVADMALLGGTSAIYQTADALYLCANRTWEHGDHDHDYTDIFKIALMADGLEVAAQGTVEGMIFNQFAIDEYEDVLRLVATIASDEDDSHEGDDEGGVDDAAHEDDVWEDVGAIREFETAIYTLDSNLVKLGSIENIAPGARVASVRFIGTTGFFTTLEGAASFTDGDAGTLFSVDVSNPRQPQILDVRTDVNLTGYLHPWSAGELLGLSNHFNPETGWMDTLVLSMFNISDPAQVAVAHELDLGAYSYTEATMNHKAIFVDTERGLIAFQAQAIPHVQSGPNTPFEGNLGEPSYAYLVYHYDGETGFTQVANIDTDAFRQQGFVPSMRGFVIADDAREHFFVGNGIALGAFAMPSFTQSGLLRY
ncbi:MAG: beta-propeller domain-containing protein [Coriobacteriia bacterium]|nr:beta-propeller domain-containing protein [Coriobacteriia bacterium]